MDCEFADMGSKNCEMSNVKCELGTANCCVALKLAIVTVTGASGRQFCTLLCVGAVVSSSTAVGHHLSKKRSVRRAQGGFTGVCRLVIRKEAWELVWLSLSE